VRVHLKKASEEYKVKKSRKIHPISNVDCEIVEQLITVFDNLQQEKLVGIFSEYKMFSDDEILKNLVRFNNNFDISKETEQISSDKTVKKFPRYFVNVNNSISIEVRSLVNFVRCEKYDYNSNEIVYQLIINKDDTNKLLVSNIIIDFKSSDEREQEFNRLQRLLSEFNIVFL